MIFRGKDIPIKEAHYEYVTMLPPMDVTYPEMTKKQALAMFDWFMENLDVRIHNMCVYLQFEGDFSPESLIELWRLVMQIFGKVPEDEFFTIRSCAGLYLAETFRHQYPQLSWECLLKGSKSLLGKNMAVLTGFYNKQDDPSRHYSEYFEPEHMICVQATRLYDGRADEEQLIRVFEKWSEKILGHTAKPLREDPYRHTGQIVILHDGTQEAEVLTPETDNDFNTLMQIIRNLNKGKRRKGKRRKDDSPDTP